MVNETSNSLRVSQKDLVSHYCRGEVIDLSSRINSASLRVISRDDGENAYANLSSHEITFNTVTTLKSDQ